MVVLSSCTLTNDKFEPNSAPASAEVKSDDLRLEKKPPTFSESQLSRAEALFHQGRLLQPEEDNAYIRYRAALMLDPENKQAKSGLDAILIHELNVVRKQIEKSQYSTARRRLNYLGKLFDASPELKSMQQSLNKQQAVAAKQIERAEAKRENDGRKYLDAVALSSKSQTIIDELRSLAIALEKTDQGVMIYARNDAEGRWIYKQMREATPNYRIRGDIRIGRRPAVKLLEPF